MELKLAQNIKAYRKQHALTQEQLAEALGLTVGAVYKWEAGLSIPDIAMLLELADFFDTSLDALLGYEIKNNKREALLLQLKEYLNKNDSHGLLEAEKALKKYPNNFDIVYQSAILYQALGLTEHKEKNLRRAIPLFEQALLLMEQNTNPEISELSIQNRIAKVYLSLGETENAIERLKKHNVCGINDGMIGEALGAKKETAKEAIPYLSTALINNVISLVDVAMGYINVFTYKEDFASMKEIIEWMLSVMQGLKQGKENSILDKLGVVFYVCLAMAELKLGDEMEAKNALKRAKEVAETFDAAPIYTMDTVRFVTLNQQASAHDDLGATALEGIENVVEQWQEKELSRLWEDIKRHEEK